MQNYNDVGLVLYYVDVSFSSYSGFTKKSMSFPLDNCFMMPLAILFDFITKTFGS